MAQGQKNHVQIAIAISIVGLFLSVIGELTEAWLEGVVDESAIRQGLFECEGKCSASIEVVQAMTVIGILTCASGIAMMIFFIMKDSLRLLPNGGVLALGTGGVCIFLGMMIYALKVRYFLTDGEDIKVGWSYGLTLSGCLVMLFAGGYAFMKGWSRM